MRITKRKKRKQHSRKVFREKQDVHHVPVYILSSVLLLNVRTTVAMTMMRAGSALKVLAQLCSKATHSGVKVDTSPVSVRVAISHVKADTSSARVAINPVRDRKAVISPVKVDTNSVREAISHVRVDTSHVRDKKAVISPVRVDTSSVREAISPVRDRVVDTSSARVVIRNPTASRGPIRKGHASIRQTTIRMPSIA